MIDTVTVQIHCFTVECISCGEVIWADKEAAADWIHTHICEPDPED